MRFLSGDTEPVLASLEEDMHAASDELQFERAARLRDRITAVRKAAETQQMVSDRAEDFDVIGVAEDPLEAAIILDSRRPQAYIELARVYLAENKPAEALRRLDEARRLAPDSPEIPQLIAQAQQARQARPAAGAKPASPTKPASP
jgi:excinuclease UvrABC nuclease subunit